MNFSSFLLLLITFLLGSALFLSAGSAFGFFSDLSLAGPVKIEVVEFSGGDIYNDSTRFAENTLILKHCGGNKLPLDSVSIQISGKGNAYSGIPGTDGKMHYGDVSVFYEHLNKSQKNSDFEKNNKGTLKDGFWTSGETFLLTGNDSLNSTVSSVFVSVGEQTNTSNNYGFSSNQTLEIRIYQKNKAGKSQLILKKEIDV